MRDEARFTIDHVNVLLSQLNVLVDYRQLTAGVFGQNHAYLYRTRGGCIMWRSVHNALCFCTFDISPRLYGMLWKLQAVPASSRVQRHDVVMPFSAPG